MRPLVSILVISVLTLSSCTSDSGQAEEASAATSAAVTTTSPGDVADSLIYTAHNVPLQATPVTDLVGLTIDEASRQATARGWVEIDVIYQDDPELFRSADLKPSVRITITEAEGLIVTAIAG